MSTIVQWIDELKSKFVAELQILSEENTTLHVNCQVLQDRLKVLEWVEKQLHSSLEDEEVDVEGIFFSNTDVAKMTFELMEVEQSMWDMIK